MKTYLALIGSILILSCGLLDDDRVDITEDDSQKSQVSAARKYTSTTLADTNILVLGESIPINLKVVKDTTYLKDATKKLRVSSQQDSLLFTFQSFSNKNLNSAFYTFKEFSLVKGSDDVYNIIGEYHYTETTIFIYCTPKQPPILIDLPYNVEVDSVVEGIDTLTTIDSSQEIKIDSVVEGIDTLTAIRDTAPVLENDTLIIQPIQPINTCGPTPAGISYSAFILPESKLPPGKYRLILNRVNLGYQNIYSAILSEFTIVE